MKRKLAVLGSTGIIGKQVLDIISDYTDLFTLEVLASNDDSDLILKQAKAFEPNAIVLTEDEAYKKVKTALSNGITKVFKGEDALCDVLAWETIDLVIVATAGFASIRPTLAAIEAGKTVAIANKEVMASAGQILRKKALENKATIIPLTRALSSIVQCLAGENLSDVEKVTFSASGGPFIDRKPNYLVNVKKEHAFQGGYQTEFMDEKTIIDSSTLMNKGLEMIAAKCLFDFNNDQLEVLVHPQSVVQSMIQFKDGNIKTQVGERGVRMPLLYALTYPKRIPSKFPNFSFKDFSKLTFGQPDEKTFRNLTLAKKAMEKGNNSPCILNAANEVVVHAFLKNKVGFLEMTAMIEEALGQIPFIENPSLEDLEQTDNETRRLTLSLTKNSQLFN